MKKKYWILIYTVILVVHLAGIFYKSNAVQATSKPLLIICLIIYFYLQTRMDVSSLKKWILIALFFSWMGDVLLIFQEERQLFFLLGLSSFLLAHIFYIIFFHKIRVRENIRYAVLLLLIVVVYYAALIFLLSPYLGVMRYPVQTYGVFISVMFLLAMHMLAIKNKWAGRLMLAGAFLFVVSDSILAVNKFYNPFEFAGIIIMLSYGAAQFFIAEGAIKYIRRKII
ncbi:MAG: lysoplasmalogenase [Bacteroidetes bacterium]|nr:lysoplasmalogenase [Bacteroidota bacterium]MBS1632218.1 lysoplasmalogenase [Bacteroidota bacterium]